MIYVKNGPIDLVIPWVNGEDPQWQQKAVPYLSVKDFSGERFRDWGILKYLFRSIDQYLPWVNQVYLVTDNQIPNWLDLNNSHVQVIDHHEIIDDQFLPTFNSNAILMNAYKIPNLSEHFMIIEDDMLFTRPAKPKDFFVNGQPRDFLIESPISPNEDFAYILMNTMMLINRKFDKRQVLKKLRNKYLSPRYGIEIVRSLGSCFYRHFTGFYNRHCVQPYLKSEFKHVVEEVFSTECRETISHRVRGNHDISEWIVRYYNLVTGNFAPSSPQRYRYFEIGQFEDIRKAVNDEKYFSICMNDRDIYHFSQNIHQLRSILNVRFSQKSSFEK